MSVIFFSFKTYSFFVKKTNQPTNQTNKQTNNIQSKHRKIRTRNNSVFGHFSSRVSIIKERKKLYTHTHKKHNLQTNQN